MAKRLSALLAAGSLAAGACACGGAGSGSSASSAVSATGKTPTDIAAPLDGAVADGDRDNDVGAAHDDTRNTRELTSGHDASAAVRRAIVALVKRYYAIALAENGAAACSMIYSTFAEAVVEDFTTTGGPPYLQGVKTCPAALTLVFKHYHAILSQQVPRLKVSHVRLSEHHGYALLSFGPLPEREILVAREGRIWRIDALIDSELG